MPSRETRSGAGSKDAAPQETNTKTVENSQPGGTRQESGGDEQEREKRSDGSNNNAEGCTEFYDDEEHVKKAQEEYRKFKESEANKEEDGADATARSESGSHDPDDATEHTKKRGQGANSVQSVNKKPKQGDSRAGDKTRVPEKGQKVQWEEGGKSGEGEVEAVYEKKGDDEAIKGSTEEPQIAVKDKSSGKTGTHPPEAVSFE